MVRILFHSLCLNVVSHAIIRVRICLNLCHHLKVVLILSTNLQDSKEFNIFNYRNYYNGGGIGVGDINNDGLPDIYYGSNFSNNVLYLNKGESKISRYYKQSRCRRRSSLVNRYKHGGYKLRWLLRHLCL